ncbi:MAG: DNA adenine methylase [Xanthomonadales bacterium]|nr:DNA adenine methylase [Xanthomonadales bacterium]
MLKNGLGELIDATVPTATRFVDLFSGSTAVARFVATRHAIPVLAVDLQAYSSVLATAIIGRTKRLDADKAWDTWFDAALRKVRSARDTPDVSRVTRETVRAARRWCELRRSRPITAAYGGHYFSPIQALWIDALRATLPSKSPYFTVALAALIESASQCVAAPGHTAQPFQPTRTAKRFLVDAWNRDVPSRVKANFVQLCEIHAKQHGRAIVGEATKLANGLRKGDLVFIDPPYSGVHYSRFYHVLETIATGDRCKAEGVGRYPEAIRRPKSEFSFKTKSKGALDKLLGRVAMKGASAILTFPDHNCSNGLSGDIVRSVARQHFEVREKVVSSKFSTLGGTSGLSARGSERAARQQANELILQLSPKRSA